MGAVQMECVYLQHSYEVNMPAYPSWWTRANIVPKVKSWSF